MISICLSKRRNFIDSEELQPLISSDSHFHPLYDSDDSELRICLESILELESIYRHYRGIGAPLIVACSGPRGGLGRVRLVRWKKLHYIKLGWLKHPKFKYRDGCPCHLQQVTWTRSSRRSTPGPRQRPTSALCCPTDLVTKFWLIKLGINNSHWYSGHILFNIQQCVRRVSWCQRNFYSVAAAAEAAWAAMVVNVLRGLRQIFVPLSYNIIVDFQSTDAPKASV